MDDEKITESWLKHIDDSLKYGSRSPEDYFSQRICRLCDYWYPLREGVLEKISKYYPDLYEHMRQGIEGKIVHEFVDEGMTKETYTIHLFYGFCKRYPPVIGQDDSIVNVGSFSVKKIKIPETSDGFRFPVLPETQGCGEWKLSEWVKDRLGTGGHIIERRKSNRTDDE